MEFEKIFQDIPAHVKALHGKGEVASYIPALACIPGDKFGMALHTVSGYCFSAGDSEERFSIQSISKVFTLSLAMGCEGGNLWRRVGREPSGNPFNSLIQLEYEKGIPQTHLSMPARWSFLMCWFPIWMIPKRHCWII